LKNDSVQFTLVKNDQSTKKSPKNRIYKIQNQRPMKQATKKNSTS